MIREDDRQSLALSPEHEDNSDEQTRFGMQFTNICTIVVMKTKCVSELFTRVIRTRRFFVALCSRSRHHERTAHKDCLALASLIVVTIPSLSVSIGNSFYKNRPKTKGQLPCQHMIIAIYYTLDASMSLISLLLFLSTKKNYYDVMLCHLDFIIG